MKVYIIERESMEVLTAFGDGGRQPGMFFAVHSIAVDSGWQHLHHGDLRRVARAEVRVQGHGADSVGRRGHEQPGRLVPMQ